MLGSIISIEDTTVTIKLGIDITSQANLINLHVVFEEGPSRVVGEIIEVDKETAKISIMGEVTDYTFLPGFSKKPSFKAIVRMISLPELGKILGDQQIKDNSQIYFGLSSIYNNYRINVSTNLFFSNHFAVLGNTGSGKSCTVARLIQNMFTSGISAPVNSNIFLFDAYGEYQNAFSKLNSFNSLVNYKNYTTNIDRPDGEILQIPLSLLGVDDFAHLLGVESANQLPIIERALSLVPIIAGVDQNTVIYKNDILARALLDILVSGNEPTRIRDQITAVLTNFNTKELNLETQITQPGYVRTLKQCLFLDKTGKIQDIDVVVDFISSFKRDDLTEKKVITATPYTLTDLENAMNFALISEGVLKSDKVFDYANILSVRLHSLANSDVATFFNSKELISKETFIRKLITTPEGKKAQIVNFNINYVDDRIAKAITKIISRLIFQFATETKNRGKIPFHIIIEEAHRYVQNDKDTDVLGYNIFDRITKEGRKYAVLLGLITQRPSELSDTSISQCSNFIILRTLHPRDLDYIRNMIPNMSSAILEQLKTLQPGSCIAFGSAFKIPISMKMELPDPEPLSNNADIVGSWY